MLSPKENVSFLLATRLCVQDTIQQDLAEVPATEDTQSTVLTYVHMYEHTTTTTTTTTH